MTIRDHHFLMESKKAKPGKSVIRQERSASGAGCQALTGFPGAAESIKQGNDFLINKKMPKRAQPFWH